MTVPEKLLDLFLCNNYLIIGTRKKRKQKKARKNGKNRNVVLSFFLLLNF